MIYGPVDSTATKRLLGDSRFLRTTWLFGRSKRDVLGIRIIGLALDADWLAQGNRLLALAHMSADAPAIESAGCDALATHGIYNFSTFNQILDTKREWLVEGQVASH